MGILTTHIWCPVGQSSPMRIPTRVSSRCELITWHGVVALLWFFVSLFRRPSPFFKSHNAEVPTSQSFRQYSMCGMLACCKTFLLWKVVLKLTQMIGKNVKLYDMVLQFLRTLFLRTRNVHYCTLRAELLMSLHDLDISEICSVDPCHKVRTQTMIVNLLLDMWWRDANKEPQINFHCLTVFFLCGVYFVFSDSSLGV